ncbi:tryptophan halogenase [Actinopolyspora mzabensis]|uniref:Tryptophan halogenase n=1 Tax=Actinopolyspora mzabensis TaxID=995066 RepID=A0A1G9EGL7_ACTMZ|nr:tryptophan halogenase family protein [Actinopolyspora mzabensis]SDK75317.1 tryptophan halogenase [Actinopolyspora mzabensis]
MVDNVVIVGGGTAGWMTATYLNATFGDQVTVSLVESPNLPTVGVGEATFSTVRHFFHYIGLREHEWMPHCSAAYKLAIRFQNWGGENEHFYHPFERPRHVDGCTLADWWLKVGSEAFDRESFVLAALCEARRSPNRAGGALFDRNLHDGGDLPRREVMNGADTQFPYAYHFDATLLAHFLADLGMRRGVHRVLDDVERVVQDETGAIDHLVTKQHGDIYGDLFIDCTGFRGLLINQTLGARFESFQDVLPNDRAVALRVPVDGESQGIAPYTTATAMDAGWAWTIPLYDRIGTGYVYSSEFTTPEQAESDLRAHVGPAADEVEANHIRMRVGRNERFWMRNCVAIGLSGGFVEPLESTGIFFIQYGIEQLVRHFPGPDRSPALRDNYNRLMAGCFDGVREFLVLHYRAARREDTPYWKAINELPLPPGMADRMELWKSRLPDSGSVIADYHGFEPYSYAVMLLGLGQRPRYPHPALRGLDSAAARAEFERVRAEAEQLVNTLPSQYEYLAGMR